MTELLGSLQDRSFARATAAASADWVSAWSRLTAERLLSYADKGTFS